MKIFSVEERVSFFETDASGIVHFMFVLRYFEIGEREALRMAGIKVGDPGRGGVHIPRVHVEVNYHHPLFYDDQIEVRTLCERIGRTSLTWHHEIYRGDERCVSGTMITVLLNKETGLPQPIPCQWRRYLQVEEGESL
ncbi:acyl-CoA thioesterase [Sulfobacillus thermosulfidooxidans]|uniref:acyl-CoA thioesterase n=1 Tax=Sulfobacillus thermosulfidooxidans TaxID=28034 RepID=UPI00041800DA|nr:thioesterase family protein [Sulfobacillus thermosulfidooxidans]